MKTTECDAKIKCVYVFQIADLAPSIYVLIQTTVASWLLPPPEVHSGAFEAALFPTFQSGLNIHNMYIEQYLQLERPSISICHNVGSNTLIDSSRL